MPARPSSNDLLTQAPARASSQDVFNLLPNLNMEELTKSFAVKSNDMMLVIYLSSMVRSVLALHNLIDNKEQRLWRERQAGEEATVADAPKADKAAADKAAVPEGDEKDNEAKGL